MQSLTVSLLQQDLVWENKSANLARFEAQIAQLPPTDIIILPEMFPTGFTMSAERHFSVMDGEEMQWMAEIAKSKNVVITGSLIIKEDGRYYNRLIWMNPYGKYKQYDKRHLFTMTGEEKVFTAGKDKLVVDCNGWKICPMICFDLRFPVFIRNKEDYDLLLFVANWPERRSHHWRSLLMARAIENQCFTIGVNRVGEDGNKINHIGSSMVLSPLGEVITELGYVPQSHTVTISKESINLARRYMPFLKEMDDFEVR